MTTIERLIYYFLIQGPEKDDPIDVYKINAGFELMCAVMSFIIACFILYEIRKAPSFVLQIPIAILCVNVAYFMLDIGVISGWWNASHWHVAGVIFFAIAIFLDTIIYMSFAIRYFEISCQVRLFLEA